MVVVLCSVFPLAEDFFLNFWLNGQGAWCYSYCRPGWHRSIHLTLHNLSVNYTSIVTSDRKGTVPAAGVMVNSTGRAWRSLVALTCQMFLDMSNNCLSEVTLGDPMPSPKTRRPKVMGTKESLEMEQVTVLGKPAKTDEDDKYETNENIKRSWSGRHCSMKVVILSSIKYVM